MQIMCAEEPHSGKRALAEAPSFCIIDVGSTTTKAILFKRDRQWGYQRFEAPTTVEKPYEDVTIGVRNALAGLAQLTSETLLKDGIVTVPCFATSSAGGGLAMIVAGLVREVTARSAERVALGAGSIILRVIALDDGCTPYKRIEILQTLRPDLVLLAGGFDGGAVFGPVFLAELLRESGLRAKLGDKVRLPVIYSGNADAREYVGEILQESFHYCEVPNIRPAAMVENLDPAREKIHEVFMEHVMSHAPGYDKLAQLVDGPIVPTPAAVSTILEHVSRHRKQNILVVDIGGATTDVYSAIDGKVFRSVSANLGMSYSILNVVAENGNSAVRELLDFEIADTELLNRIGTKYLHPTSLPADRKDAAIECAIATLAIRQAVAEHLSMLHGVSLSLTDEELGWNRLKKIVKKGGSKSARPSLAGYDLIVGSGGKLSHSPRDSAAMILINALEPENSVDIAVDSAFIFPQLGMIAQRDVELAVKLFFEIGLVRLGKLVAPVGRAKPGTKVIDIEWEDVDGKHKESVSFGRLQRLAVERATRFALKTRKLKLNTRMVNLEEDQPGLIVDTRGRPAEQPSGFELPADYQPPVRESVFKGQTRIERGVITVKRELAISGEVCANVGDTVTAKTVVARSVRTFLRPFFIDIAGKLKVPPSEMETYLKKRIGERIEREEVIAEKRGVVDAKVLRSGVTGTLEKILPSGAIVIREEQEQITGLQSVNVAKELGVRPDQVKRHLRCEVGQEVEKGQRLARLSKSSSDIRVCLSPIRGRIRDISLKYGIVVVEPLLEELLLEAWMPGRVTSLTDRGCTIENRGTTIQAKWGNGGKVAAKTEIDDPARDKIAIRQHVGEAELAGLNDVRAAGLIAATMDLQAVLNIEPSFPIVVVDGFGRSEANSEAMELLSAGAGRLLVVDAETQLRAGVVRPRVYILEE